MNEGAGALAVLSRAAFRRWRSATSHRRRVCIRLSLAQVGVKLIFLFTSSIR